MNFHSLNPLRVYSPYPLQDRVFNHDIRFCRILIYILSLVSLSVVGCQFAEETSDRVMGSSIEKLQIQNYHAQVCADGETTFGIDVSKWQGEINWDEVADDGVKFAVIRVSDGLEYYDNKFEQNWENAGRVGILRSVYQFFRPNLDPIQQAQLLIDSVNRVGGQLDLPPVIDVEATGDRSAAQIQQAMRQWIDLVEEAFGMPPIIYTGFYFWQDHVDGSTDFNQYPLWHPQYTSAECPRIADAWDDWLMWQYTSEGRVNGISGDVDLNRFNGSEDDLYALAQSMPRMIWGGQPRNQSFPLASQPPIELCLGERIEGEIWVRNTGNQAWDERVYLAPTPRDQASTLHDQTWISPTRITPALDLPIQVEEEGTFRFIIQGNELGESIHSFGLLAEGETWFADSGGPHDEYLALNVNVSSCTVNYHY